MSVDFKNEFLSPFIVDYMFHKGWADLNDIQKESFIKFKESDSDLVISSKTASGKTEAAFFPVIEEMEKHYVRGVSCLYISPLKALINDQFSRLSELLEKSSLKVFRWHGDVSSFDKKKAIESFNSVLEITPESLESLFINHHEDLLTLFSNLKYIIIDEIHYFIENERGIHLIALLDRIRKLINRRPRYICLSATLSNIEIVGEFIGSNSIQFIKQNNSKDIVRLLIDTADNEEYYSKIYKYINGKKTIVFGNSRSEVEDIAIELKKRNELYGGNNYILVHHGSISKDIRTEVEKRLKNKDGLITACATNTLELGIDIGTLQRIVQNETCFSINSFVQRLGRSGRGKEPKEMVFIHNLNRIDSSDPLEILDIFPNQFIHNIAMIELYTKEKYLEPLSFNKYPFQVLVLELLSYLSTHSLITSQRLESYLLDLVPFRYINSKDFKSIVYQLIDMEIIYETEDSLLDLTEKGERLINDFHIYAIFKTPEEWDVFLNNKLIGSITEKVSVGRVINLAGNNLKVIKINIKEKKILTEATSEKGSISFHSNSNFIVDERLTDKVRELLEEYRELPYLTNSAKEIYKDCVLKYRIVKESLTNNVIRYNNGYLLIPYLGTKDFNSLVCFLKKKLRSIEKINDFFYPYLIYIEDNMDHIKYCLNNIDEIKNGELVDYEEFKNLKFNQFIPKDLLTKEYSNIFLNTNFEYKKIINRLKL